jgi:hypothetical protein
VRILITGKNNTITADAMQSAVIPRTPRVTFHAPAAARPVSARLLRADLVIVGGRAANFLPASKAQLGPHLSARAPSFDLIAGQWIVPPPGAMPEAGAAAELRHTQAAHTRPAGSSALSSAGRPLLGAAVEALTVALGLTVFGLIAGVFLVLA